MNLLEIRTEVRRILAETTAASSYVSDTDINKFINDGVKHMCIEGGVYEKTHSITVATTISAYKLPLDFLTIKVLRNHNGVPLDPIESVMVGAAYSISGLPLNYYATQTPVILNAWTVATPYVLFPATCVPTATYIRPVTANGYIYECVVAGTSHAATEPTWGTVVGSRLTEAGLVTTWACREFFTSLFTLNLYDTPITAIGVGTYILIYSALDEGLYVDTDSPNFPLDKHHYLIPFACFRCAFKAKDVALAAAFLSEYSAGMGLQMNVPGAGGGAGGPQS